MRFSRECKTAALALILILGFLPVLGAQSASGVWGALPKTQDLHFPVSSVNRASAGTISGDADAFMSAANWPSIENMNSFFVLAGVDEYGLALGFAKKLGKAYFGASYSGDLIDEIYRRVTNRETGSLIAGMSVRKTNDAVIGRPGLYTQDGSPPAGEKESSNDVNLIFGIGIFGLRLGFSEYIRSVDYVLTDNAWEGQDSLETSLKPNLELGFNIPAGRLTIKPALWGAFDIRGFEAFGGFSYYDYNNTAFKYYAYWNRFNFMEPSGGLTLDVKAAISDTASVDFGLEWGGAFRLYPDASDPDSLVFLKEESASAFSSPIDFPFGVNAAGFGGFIEGTIPLDIRSSGALKFGFTSDISEHFTLAGKFRLLGAFNKGKLDVKLRGTTVSAETMRNISGAPDLALGASVHLIPGRFSLHGGIGVQLFSYSYSTLKVDSAPSAETVTTFDLPSVRLGGGLTLNLTEAAALDIMAFSSGLNLESTVLNLLFRVKK
jgi:hypothetical protein